MTESASVDVEAVRRRAHESSLGPDAGKAEENWLRAEQGLRGPAEDEDAVRQDEGEAARNAQHGERLQADLSSLMHPETG